MKRLFFLLALVPIGYYIASPTDTALVCNVHTRYIDTGTESNRTISLRIRKGLVGNILYYNGVQYNADINNYRVSVTKIDAYRSVYIGYDTISHQLSYNESSHNSSYRRIEQGTCTRATVH